MRESPLTERTTHFDWKKSLSNVEKESSLFFAKRKHSLESKRIRHFRDKNLGSTPGKETFPPAIGRLSKRSLPTNESLPKQKAPQNQEPPAFAARSSSVLDLWSTSKKRTTSWKLGYDFLISLVVVQVCHRRQFSANWGRFWIRFGDPRVGVLSRTNSWILLSSERPTIE